MTSGSGIVFMSLMGDAGFGEQAFGFTSVIFITSVIFSLLLISGFKYIPSKNRSMNATVSYDKPEPFTSIQKTNLTLILTMIILVLTFPILHLIAPHSATITFINSKIHVGLIAIVFSVIALLFNLAPQKEVIAKVPWNTILMICGVGMLIQIAIKAGTIQQLADWAGSSLPSWLVPIAFSIIGAFMSFFSSTIGVVCPALFPLVPSLGATTGIAPMVLFTCIVIGAQSSAISPFSSGGSLILVSCSTEEVRSKLFNRLLLVAIPVSILSATVFNIILSVIL
jgi:di/tricarboxylate transporter